MEHSDSKEKTGGDEERDETRRDPVVDPKANKKRVKVAGWPGYVRLGTFIIEKKIRGIKWHVSTRCSTLRAAVHQLGIFESDPKNYAATHGHKPDAVVLDEALIEEFFIWHAAKVSRPWALDVRRLLREWADHLKGEDLRKLSLVGDLKPHLRDFPTQRHHRVKAIRVLFRWLRTEKGLIARGEDVTLDLPIPVIRPAQETKSKAVEHEAVAEHLRHLPQSTRDVLLLMSVTGWHITDTQRFASMGDIRERTDRDAPDVLAVLATKMKGTEGGRWHFTAIVHPEALEAARRILASGHVIDRGALRKHMIAAAKLATAERRKKNPKAPKVPHLNLGAMRASVSTWLAQAGLGAEVWRYLGHTSPVMSTRHYINPAKAPVIVPRAALRIVR